MVIVRSNEELAIPYGTVAPRAATLAAVGDGACNGINLPGAPVAVIDCSAGAPLPMWPVALAAAGSGPAAG